MLCDGHRCAVLTSSADGLAKVSSSQRNLRGSCSAPFSPVRWVHIYPLASGRIDPAVRGAPTAKHERVRIVPLDHGEFKVAVERGRADGMPGDVGHRQLRIVSRNNNCSGAWFPR